jgi:DNA-binding protein HU-beta
LGCEGGQVNRNDLIADVASEAGLSKADATKAVDAVFRGIGAVLGEGGDFRMLGFGTFSVSERPASEGRNPRTGEKVHIAASKQVKFKAGSELKRLVNGGRGRGGEELNRGD